MFRFEEFRGFNSIVEYLQLIVAHFAALYHFTPNSDESSFVCHKQMKTVQKTYLQVVLIDKQFYMESQSTYRFVFLNYSFFINGQQLRNDCSDISRLNSDWYFIQNEYRNKWIASVRCLTFMFRHVVSCISCAFVIM